MPKVITYKALKKQLKEWHQLVYNGENYTLTGFRELCFRTQTWEYAPGSVQLYDTRHKTFSDPELVEDPTPDDGPDGVVVALELEATGTFHDPDLATPEPPAAPAIDYSVPPPGFVPGPIPTSDEPAAVPPPAEPVASPAAADLKVE